MVQQRYKASEQLPVSLTGNRQLSSRPTAPFLRARLSASGTRAYGFELTPAGLLVPQELVPGSRRGRRAETFRLGA